MQKSTRQFKAVQRASAIGMTVTPKASEIQTIPLEGALAFWHEDRWWTPGAMRAANVPLDLSGIIGVFGSRMKVWKVRVWTPAETLNIFNDLTSCAPDLA